MLPPLHQQPVCAVTLTVNVTALQCTWCRRDYPIHFSNGSNDIAISTPIPHHTRSALSASISTHTNHIRVTTPTKSYTRLPVLNRS